MGNNVNNTCASCLSWGCCTVCPWPSFPYSPSTKAILVGHTGTFTLPLAADCNSLTMSSLSAYPYITYSGTGCSGTFTILPGYSIAAITIPITLTLTDGIHTSTDTLTINIQNDPPKDNFSDQTPLRGTTSTYTPSYSDAEGYTPIGFLITSILPSYVTYASGVFTMSPLITEILTSTTIFI